MCIKFHPGYYLKEIIFDDFISLDEIVDKSKIDKSVLVGIINEEVSVNADLAAKLANCFGISVNFWLNLQKTYDE